jgi:putative zinc finger protein
MSCAYDKEKLTGFFDGELESTEKTEVEKHISACSECLRDLGEIKSAAQLVKTLPRLRAPASIAEGVSRELASAGRVHSMERYRKTILWTFAAAAGFFIVANVAYFTGGQGRPSGDPVAARPSAAPGLGRVAPTPMPDAEEERKAVDSKSDQPHRADDLKRSDANKDKRAEEKAAAPVPEARRKAESEELQKFKGDALENRALRESAKPGDPKAPTEQPAVAKMEKQNQGAAPAAPPAPAAAAPPRAPAPENKAGEKDGALALKEGGRFGAADLQQQKQLAGGLVAPASYTVSTPQVAMTRAKANEVLAKLGVKTPPPANATDAKKAVKVESLGAEPASMTVELTAAQFAELKKQLEAQSGVKLVAGGPDEALAAGQGYRARSAPVTKGPPGGGAGAGKADEASRGIAGPAAKPQATQPAPFPAEAKKAEPEADRSKERAESTDKAKGAKETTGALQEEPRQTYVLYFTEVPAEKK